MLLAVPMQHLREVASRLPFPGVPLVNCAKGVEQATLRLPLGMAQAPSLLERRLHSLSPR